MSPSVDLTRAVTFYCDVGLFFALEGPKRDAAFLWIGGSGEAMLGLCSLESAPIALSLHIAFSGSDDEHMSPVVRAIVLRRVSTIASRAG
jgi:hypothetical protein